MSAHTRFIALDRVARRAGKSSASILPAYWTGSSRGEPASALAVIARNFDALFRQMKNSATSQRNKALAEKIRSRAAKFDDRNLQAKANSLAQIVEQAETEAPTSVLDLIFRKPTAPERNRGLELEAIARQHRKALE
jgi:hypothetical protein